MQRRSSARKGDGVVDDGRVFGGCKIVEEVPKAFLLRDE